MKVINISKVSEEGNLAKKTSKRNNVVDSTLRDVDAYKHKKETRKNAVPVGLASYDTSKPKPKKYEYNPHLDPQLVWTEKAEHTSCEVPTVSLHIHESQLWCLTLKIQCRYI